MARTSCTSAPQGRSIDGRRRAKGNAEPANFPGRVDHFLGPRPVPGEVLVVEDRRGAVAVTKDIDDLLKILVAGIEDLSFFVLREGAVLGDQQHAVDRQAVGAAGEGLGDGGVAFQLPVATHPFAAQVVVSHLFDIQGDDLHGRPVVPAFPAVTFQEAVHDVLRVGELLIVGRQGGDPGSPVGGRAGQLRQSEGTGSGRQEIPS